MFGFRFSHIVAGTSLLFILAGLYWASQYSASLASLFGPLSADNPWFPVIIILAAILDSVNPCAFSVLVLTIAFLFSLGRSRGHILAVGSTYIAAIFLTYVFIGVGVLQTLSLFGITHGLAKFGAATLILFGGIALLNEFFPSFPIKLKIPDFAHAYMAHYIERATVISAFVLGILVGMFEFPCTGGPYLLVLGLLHDHATLWQGVFYLTLYNAIFVLPLFVILVISANQSLLQKFDALRRRETRASRLWLALLTLALGGLIFIL